MKSGNLNFLEPSGPVQACNGTALPFFLTHFCYRLSRPQGHSAIGTIWYQWKIPMTPVGIEPATFRIVAQHLTHCANPITLTLVQQLNIRSWNIFGPSCTRTTFSLNGSTNWSLHTEPWQWHGLHKPLTNLATDFLKFETKFPSSQTSRLERDNMLAGLVCRVESYPERRSGWRIEPQCSSCRLRITRVVLQDWMCGATWENWQFLRRSGTVCVVPRGKTGSFLEGYLFEDNELFW